MKLAQSALICKLRDLEVEDINYPFCTKVMVHESSLQLCKCTTTWLMKIIAGVQQANNRRTRLPFSVISFGEKTENFISGQMKHVLFAVFTIIS